MFGCGAMGVGVMRFRDKGSGQRMQAKQGDPSNYLPETSLELLAKVACLETQGKGGYIQYAIEIPWEYWRNIGIMEMKTEATISYKGIYGAVVTLPTEQKTSEAPQNKVCCLHFQADRNSQQRR